MTKRGTRIRRNTEINYCKEKGNKTIFFSAGRSKLIAVFPFQGRF